MENKRSLTHRKTGSPWQSSPSFMAAVESQQPCSETTCWIQGEVPALLKTTVKIEGFVCTCSETSVGFPRKSWFYLNFRNMKHPEQPPSFLWYLSWGTSLGDWAFPVVGLETGDPLFIQSDQDPCLVWMSYIMAVITTWGWSIDKKTRAGAFV